MAQMRHVRLSLWHTNNERGFGHVNGRLTCNEQLPADAKPIYSHIQPLVRRYMHMNAAGTPAVDASAARNTVNAAGKSSPTRHGRVSARGSRTWSAAGSRNAARSLAQCWRVAARPTSRREFAPRTLANQLPHGYTRPASISRIASLSAAAESAAACGGAFSATGREKRRAPRQTLRAQSCRAAPRPRHAG